MRKNQLQQRLDRRQDFWRARVQEAASPAARVAAATDCLRLSLTRAHREEAERVALDASEVLLRTAATLDRRGAHTHDCDAA